MGDLKMKLLCCNEDMAPTESVITHNKNIICKPEHPIHAPVCAVCGVPIVAYTPAEIVQLPGCLVTKQRFSTDHSTSQASLRRKMLGRSRTNLAHEPMAPL